jgi:hypothetical protein
MSKDRSFSVDDARAAADAGRLASWVADFLASPGSDNAELGEQLASEYPVWQGPIELPFDRLHRLAGPPDQPTLERLDSDDLETVDAMEDSIDDGWTPPPFVVTWQDDHLVLEDGNHRVEGLRRSGHDDYWCVVGYGDEDARSDFEIERTTWDE